MDRPVKVTPLTEKPHNTNDASRRMMETYEHRSVQLWLEPTSFSHGMVYILAAGDVRSCFVNMHLERTVNPNENVLACRCVYWKRHPNLIGA